ncbi:putative Fumarylacetoacetase [Podospora fimiseda]|uniref:Fumarylacetoacetase n=1 Tax=Podospora fimiseda TaxID=252190 RepID=A0AAN7BSQ0_9PEZI|nr:putative Fumarylacetoacetase [Podospora fimiseda]
MATSCQNKKQSSSIMVSEHWTPWHQVRNETWMPTYKPDSEFSMANFPLGIVSHSDEPRERVATILGEEVIDLRILTTALDVSTLKRLFPGLGITVARLCATFSESTLNEYAELGRHVHRIVRKGLQDLFRIDTPFPEILRDNSNLQKECIFHQTQVRMLVPMQIGDYTDFYAGYHHAYHVGVMFRGPDNALQPNYTHLPVGYHGRASSIVVSGTPIKRPIGQILVDQEKKQPVTEPTRKLDFEVELGAFITKPNKMGEPVSIEDAQDYIFGYVLLNDWSARDIQSWEYVPLGPFNGKNFASTISPWVVMADALEPFRTTPIENKTEIQKYLRETQKKSVYDIELEVDITTAEGETTTIGRTNSKFLMWSFPQMIAHHTLNGCPLRSGDLLGSGTISGPGGADERGSLLEMSEGGKRNISLNGGDLRTFLKDGDTVTLRGVCGTTEAGKVGFGQCEGRIRGAVKWSSN